MYLQLRTVMTTRNRINQALLTYIRSETSELALAAFRICYSLVLLVEIGQLFYFRRLIFDPIPYIQSSGFNWDVLLLAWLLATLLILAGAFTRIACTFNYACTVFVITGLSDFEYHVDCIYATVNFLLVFAPVSRRLAIDAILNNVPDDTRAVHTTRPITSRVFADALLFLGLGLVYGDSVVYKLQSEMWLNGLGVWLPASLSQCSWFAVPQFVLDQKWLMVTLGYLTILFEASFPVLMWW